MLIQSPGRQSDLIFNRFLGTVQDRGPYTVVQTPSNPDHYWGNYLVFAQSPRRGDLARWMEIFKAEFSFYPEHRHFAFSWDVEEEGDVGEFLDYGFELQKSMFLSTSRVNPPPHFNEAVDVRPLVTTEEWDACLQLQIRCADPKFVNEHYAEFRRRQMIGYQQMEAAGMGHWYGAFLKGRLVADLGLYGHEGIARFQNVETDPDFRRQGLCGTLVYQAAKAALRKNPDLQLMMEADPEAHAARIYKSLGFQSREAVYSLSWWKL